MEKIVDYNALNVDLAIKQICKFISGIWQILPFREGNTRTTVVFTMKYLQTFGFTLITMYLRITLGTSEMLL